METFITESLKTRRKGFIRSGIVKVLPIRRTSDWLPENSDSAFMNTGAKRSYVVPRSRTTRELVDPLGDLTDDQKNKVARELGLKDAQDLNIRKAPEKQNYWINRTVPLDRNGTHLNLSDVGDYIQYKILEVNLDEIAPSWEERYNKGTYKFAIVFADEEAKMTNSRIDTKKEAYVLFGKMDGSIKKMTDFLWIYYLTSKEGKRIPIDANHEYLRGEIFRIIEEKTGDFMAIATDPDFETKALIQKAINIGLIARSGMSYTIFGEPKSNTLEELIVFLKDDRYNNIRLSLIGKIEANEKATAVVQPVATKEETAEEPKPKQDVTDFMMKFNQLEELTKKAIENNTALKETVTTLEEENKKLRESLNTALAPKTTATRGKGKKPGNA